jgi:hypothetical protein
MKQYEVMSQAEKLQATLVKRFGSAQAVTEWRRRIGTIGGARSKGGGFLGQVVLSTSACESSAFGVCVNRLHGNQSQCCR